MVSRLRPWVAGATFGVSCWLLGSPGFAEPSAAQKETARGLMAEARELRESGDVAAALQRFLAADSLMRVPTTGFEVAATQALAGQLVEARDTLRRVMAIPPVPDEPEPFREARARAQALDQELLGRIGALRFRVTGAPAAEVSLVVDGESVPAAALDVPFRVNPGRHVVVARARGRELVREVIAPESDTVEVSLGFPANVPAAPPDVPRLSVGSEAGWPTLAYVGGGVAIIGIVAGSVTGVSAISHKNAAKRECVEGRCPPSSHGDLDSAQSMATASTVGFAVGAVGIAVVITSILLRDDSARAFRVTPEVGAQSARLSVGGTF